MRITCPVISLYTKSGYSGIMKTEVTLVRSPGDRALPQGVFVPVEYSAHAPRKHYRVVVNSSADAKAASKFGVPLALLDSKYVREMGYPANFPSRLLVARSLVGAVDSRFKQLIFENAKALEHLRPEDAVVAMLFVDWLGARHLVRVNRKSLDPEYLRMRVIEESAEARAYRVRLDDYVPGLPKSGKPLNRHDLRVLDSTQFVRASKDERQLRAG